MHDIGFLKMGKKKIFIIALLIIVIAVAGGAGWWFFMHHKKTDKLPVLINSDISLPTFTLSMTKKDGMTGYLVIGLTVAVKGSDHLPPDWLKSHNPRVRSAILSSLLNLKNMDEMNTNKSVRAEVRKFVSADMQSILSKHYKVSGVYITKLIVQ